MSLLLVQLNTDQLTEIIQVAVRKTLEDIPKLPPREEPERPMTVAEAAKYLSLSIPTVYALISRGELPVKKRSKRCYFFASDLNNYLKGGSKKSSMEIEETGGKYLESLIKKKC